MENTSGQSRWGLTLLKGSVAAIAAAAFLIAGGAKSFADDGVSMAPPIDISDQAAPSAPSDASSVFNWTEVPVNQRVPLTGEVFDKSGYQLYDTVGETILVPFTDNNLYVMKFAVSPDGTTFFENDGSNPVLYLPEDGYLINQAAGGARWYPFTNGFDPATPVFLGCAPSWDDFCDMGWYPGMVIYGGYWCGGPRFAFDALVPCDGFFISVGFSDFYGWAPYWGYVHLHPAPYRVGYIGGDWHGWNIHHGADVVFRGAGGASRGSLSVGIASRGFGVTASSGRTFRGAIGFGGGYSAPIHAGDTSRGNWNTGGHQFQGGSWSGAPSTADRTWSNNQSSWHGGGSAPTTHSWTNTSNNSWRGSTSGGSASHNWSSQNGWQSTGGNSGSAASGRSWGGQGGGAFRR